MRWLALLTSLHAANAPVPTSAAEYYYRHHEYAEALPLWKEVAAREPANLTALLRVAEMTLWLEGRDALVQPFQRFLSQKGLSPQTRRLARTRLLELQSTFLTDKAQGLFFQAKHRAERGDRAGAKECLNQASELDPGQFPILSLRAELEKEAGEFENYYQSLQAAVKSVPYDSAAVWGLALAHLAFKEPIAAVRALREVEAPNTLARKTVWAVALADAGQNSQALAVLKPLLVPLPQKGISPVAFFAMAQALETAGSKDEAALWYRRFLAAPDILKSLDWDPFRLQDRAAEARKKLSART